MQGDILLSDPITFKQTDIEMPFAFFFIFSSKHRVIERNERIFISLLGVLNGIGCHNTSCNKSYPIMHRQMRQQLYIHPMFVLDIRALVGCLCPFGNRILDPLRCRNPFKMDVAGTNFQNLCAFL